jgi:hypothetical protein
MSVSTAGNIMNLAMPLTSGGQAPDAGVQTQAPAQALEHADEADPVAMGQEGEPMVPQLQAQQAAAPGEAMHVQQVQHQQQAQQVPVQHQQQDQQAQVQHQQQPADQHLAQEPAAKMPRRGYSDRTLLMCRARAKVVT